MGTTSIYPTSKSAECRNARAWCYMCNVDCAATRNQNVRAGLLVLRVRAGSRREDEIDVAGSPAAGPLQSPALTRATVRVNPFVPRSSFGFLRSHTTRATHTVFNIVDKLYLEFLQASVGSLKIPDVGIPIFSKFVPYRTDLRYGYRAGRLRLRYERITKLCVCIDEPSQESSSRRCAQGGMKVVDRDPRCAHDTTRADAHVMTPTAIMAARGRTCTPIHTHRVRSC